MKLTLYRNFYQIFLVKRPCKDTPVLIVATAGIALCRNQDITAKEISYCILIGE